MMSHDHNDYADQFLSLQMQGKPMPEELQDNEELCLLWARMLPEAEAFKLKSLYQGLMLLGHPLPDPTNEWEEYVQGEFRKEQRRSAVSNFKTMLKNGYDVPTVPADHPLHPILIEAQEEYKKEYQENLLQLSHFFLAMLTGSAPLSSALMGPMCSCQNDDCVHSRAFEEAQQMHERGEQPDMDLASKARPGGRMVFYLAGSPFPSQPPTFDS